MLKTSPVPGSNGDRYIPFDRRTGDTSVVYFTRDLSAQGLVNIFRRVGGVLTEKPARSCVAVKTLPKNVLCEVEAIAEVK